MNRSGLITNHGGLAIAPRGVPQDIAYCDSERISSFSLSTSSSNPPEAIPGVQELFTKFSSPLHPSPIFAGTLGAYADHIENYINDLVATQTTSSCVTTPQSLYSDPISSAEGQSNLENSFEASSSSAIDLVDFPSNLMSGTLDDFDSLNCNPNSDHLPNEERLTSEDGNKKNCESSLDDEDMDIVPNELVQFVSESTRRIQGEAVHGVSADDADLEEIDHDARLASLCLPILQPPSLVSSQTSDGVRPPSLSPHPPTDCPFAVDNSSDLTDIEFTRAYLSEPTDSHPELLDTKEFDGYPSVPSLNELNTSADPDVSQSRNASPIVSVPIFEVKNGQITVASPSVYAVQKTEFDEMVMKSSPDSGVAESYFASPVFSRLSPNSNGSHCFTASVDMLQTESHTKLDQSADLLQPGLLPADNRSLPVTSSTDEFVNARRINSLASFADAPPLNRSSFDKSVTSVELFPRRLESKSAISTTQDIPTSTAVGVSLGSFDKRTYSAPSGISTSEHPFHSYSSHCKSSTGASDGLLRVTNAHKESSHSVLSTVLLAPVDSNTVLNSNVSLEDPVASRFRPRVPSTHVLYQSTQNIHANNNALFPPTTTVQLVSQNPPLTQSISSVFTPAPQSSFSFLLTTGVHKHDNYSNPSIQTQDSNRNLLNSLGLPLQILQALPSLCPGMSILLNVKSDKTAGTVPLTTVSPTVNHDTTVPKSDASVFLFPNVRVPVSDASRNSSSVGLKMPQVISPQRTCTLQSAPMLLVPSCSSSNTNPVIFSNSSNSIPVASMVATTTCLSNTPASTQFILLNSTPKSDVKFTGVTQVPVMSSTTSEMAFFISANSSQKVHSKSPSLLFLPSAVPSSLANPSPLFPASSNSLSMHSLNPSQSAIIDTNHLSPWGYRPTDLQSLLSLTPGSNCFALEVDQHNANLQNTLLAAALNRSVSNSPAMPFPVTVLPNSPQTIVLSPTSILQSSSTLNTLIPTSVISPSLPTVSQTANSVSLQLDSNVQITPTCYTGHSSTSTPSSSNPSTILSTASTTVTCVATTAGTINNQPSVSMFESKKLFVLPSADNLLSSRASLVSCISPSVSVTSQQTYKTQESNFPRLASCPTQSKSPGIVPILNSSITPTKPASAPLAAQSMTTNTASGRRRHQCPYCPKSCERKDNLQAHIRTHTGERPYPCRFCSKAFPQKDHLRAHIRTHTGEKPYRCPQCLKAFAQLGNLHRHVKTHRR